MSDYGLRIFREDGSFLTLNSETTVSKILGVSRVPRDGLNLAKAPFNTGIVIPEGYDYYCWNSGPIGPYDMLWYKGPWGFHRYFSRLDSARRVLIDTTNTFDYRIPALFYAVIAWPAKTQQKSSYGLELLNGSSLFRLTGSTSFSTELFRGELTIDYGWSQSRINPALNRNNSIVFFYTTDPNVCISGHEEKSQINFYPVDVNSGSPKAVRAKVVVFGESNASHGLKKDTHGLEIYKDGVLIYNSGWRMLMRPVLVNLKGMAQNSMTGVAGVRRPMYMPTAIGQYGVRTLYQRSDGFSIGAGVGRVGSDFAHPSPWFVGDAPIMVIDAEDYFSF
ncbi:hypothetical protein [Edwardsiella tarda]|uniref:hypothetical protein n=1 Tax=Edwardsiella tarda TaxID=636 RepID=UPI000BE3A25E|nr:hypothetical protein [Edwardsiella tarda]ATI62780.1 hypothetical protein CPU03_00105 [Edwardsiella tarda]